MKRLLITLVFCLYCGLSLAESRYVSDELRITLRSGPSQQNQIIKVLTSGTKMEFLEEAEIGKRTYAKVRTEDGKEGWVLSQYLVDSPVARDRLVSLERKTAKTITENKQLKERLSELTSQNKSTQSSNSELEQKLTDTLAELERIKGISSRAVQIDKDNRELNLQLSQLENEYKIVQSETEALKDSSQREWFIYGGLMAIGSLLLGIMLTRIRWQKRNSSWGSSL